MTERLLILITIAGFSMSMAERPNLIPDGGFEGSGGFPGSTSPGVVLFSQWRFAALDPATAEGRVVSGGRTGAYSFELNEPVNGPTGVLDNDEQSIRPFVEPGRRYRLSAWARSAEGVTLQLTVGLRDENDEYTGVAFSQAFPLNNDWQEVAVTFEASAPEWPLPVESALTAFRVAGQGRAQIDDVALRLDPAEPPAAPIVVLPTGVATTPRPAIEWRGEDFDEWEVRVTRQRTIQSEAVYTASGNAMARPRHEPTRDLPADETLWAHARLKRAGTWGPWNTLATAFRIDVNQLSAEREIAWFDLDYTRNLQPERAFEQAHLVSALQGIVNREEPRLYLRFVKAWWEDLNIDDFWLNEYRGDGRWLEHANVQTVSTIEDLVARFPDDIQGVVLWDRDVAATSNIASIIAGAENLLPIPFDGDSQSLYSRLVTGGPQLPVVIDLGGKFTGTGMIPDTNRPSTGSTKNDAYIWALERYLKPGKLNPEKMGHYIDAYWIGDSAAGIDYQNHTLTNQDYFIANKAFIWDLNVWGNETPIDDPGQPLGTDLNTLKEILRAAYDLTSGEAMIHIGGFTPWAFKYTDETGGNNGGVSSEWELIRVASAYNAYIDADALHLSGIANASFWQHLPLPKRYTQPLPLTREEMIRRGYLAQSGRVANRTFFYNYIGDYDAAAWTANTLPTYWDAPERGEIPMPWAVSPTNSQRAPQWFEYAYRTRTQHDTFVAGSSGPGYVNPDQLIEPRAISGLPAAGEAFTRHGKKFYTRFDYDFSGFLIGGHTGQNEDAAMAEYQAFSGNGLVTWGYTYNPPRLIGQTPLWYHVADLARENPPAMAAAIAGSAAERTQRFVMFRSVLNDASIFTGMEDLFRNQYANLAIETVSEDTFAYLTRAANDWIGNETRASYLWDTLPHQISRGASVTVEFALRNDGWEAWLAEGEERTALHLKIGGGVDVYIDLPRDVPPGDSIVLTTEITPPISERVGRTTILYGMEELVEGNWTAFYDLGRDWSIDGEIEITESTAADLWLVQ